MNTENSITLHSKSGLVVPISRRAADGQTIDISGRTFRFKTESGLNILCTADPSNASGLLLTITEIHTATIGAGNSTKFALIDETSVPDEVVWSGVMTVTGW